jgi:hypothetical protein
MATTEQLQRQCDSVIRAIDAVCLSQGREAADDYMAALLMGTVDYLALYRGRRQAYDIVQRLADEIITSDLPQ